MNQTDSPHLVQASRLSTRIRDPDVRVFDCRFLLTDPSYGIRVYREGHLPGAHYAHLDERLSSPIGPQTGRHPLPEPEALARWLGHCGVTRSTHVVVYDDAGGVFAVRLWWLLRWLGHERVSLLDGGFQSWVAAGGELSTEVPSQVAGVFPADRHDEIWVTTRDLIAELDAGRILLIDARARERFRGEVEPLDAVAGHIPGAINLPMTENLDANGRFLSPPVLRERFLTVMGDVPPDRVVHHCGSGVTACHNLLAMEVAGLLGSRLYAGSWSEWIRSPDRPVATGA